MQDNNEAAESQDTYPNAGRDSGYVVPVGENIINRVTELMVGPQTKLVQLTAQLDSIVKVQDQRFDYVLRQLSAYLEKEDQRHAVYDRSEQTTLQALTSVAHRLDEITSYVQQSVTIAKEALTVSKAGAARLGKLEKQSQALKSGQARYNKRLDELDKRHQSQWAEVVERLNSDDERLNSKRVRIEKLEADVKDLKEWVTGLPTPEEAHRLIALLEQIAAERGGDG